MSSASSHAPPPSSFWLILFECSAEWQNVEFVGHIYDTEFKEIELA